MGLSLIRPSTGTELYNNTERGGGREREGGREEEEATCPSSPAFTVTSTLNLAATVGGKEIALATTSGLKPMDDWADLICHFTAAGRPVQREQPNSHVDTSQRRRGHNHPYA